MKSTRIIMGMPVMVEIVGATDETLEAVFAYLTDVDKRFSTYKTDSEISKINRGELTLKDASSEMQEVFALSKETKKRSRGYFSIYKPDGSIDPSGLVKGWAVRNAARLVDRLGYEHYFLDVAGDIQSRGFDSDGKLWTIGIRNPFNREQIVKVLIPQGKGVATSGTYIRGQHIYNPHEPTVDITDIVSLTVLGPDIYEADRFATAAFAMGSKGIVFIENLSGFEGYSIDKNGIATMTSNFKDYTLA